MRSIREIIGDTDEVSADSLIPLLQRIQEERGYVSPAALQLVADAVKVPASRVYGVATFYNQFRLAPLGRHVIEVCRGTACHVKQSLTIAQHLERKLRLRPDGNSPDGRFTVLPVACLGACSIAPVMRMDGKFYGHLDAAKVDRLLADIDARDAQEAREPQGAGS